MSSHSLKLAFRKLFRYRSFTLINLTALAVTLSACTIIFVYVTREFSYDKHIPDNDRTYRIISRYQDGKYWARTFFCFTDALSDRAEIEKLTALVPITGCIINIGESTYSIRESIIADTMFLDFFGLDMISGSAEDLGHPDVVFITPEMAEKFFPGTDPVGQEILLKQFEGNTADSIGYFTVRGIVKSLPPNTHFGYQMIFSQRGNFTRLMNRLKGSKVYGASVYVRLYRASQAGDLAAVLGESLVPRLGKTFGPPIEAFNSKLQAVRDIHFSPDINREPRPVTPKSMILLLFSIGILILTLMITNFLNVVIVQAQQQRKESGIMRTFGANRGRLFQLTLVRMSVFIGLGLLLSWLLIGILGPRLGYLLPSGRAISPLDPAVIFTGALTGLPVLILSALGMHISTVRCSTVTLIKGETSTGRRRFTFFGLLTIVQFSIIIFLLSFSIIIGRQMKYFDSMDLGYEEEHIYVVRIPTQQSRGSLLVEEMERQSGVISAYTAHHHPGDVFQQMEFSAGDKKYQFGFRMVDPGIFETLDISIIEDYTPPGKEMEGWVINETFYQQLLKDFTTEDIAASNFHVENTDPGDARSKFRIAGVMEDIHYSSLHSRIGNFAYAMRHSERNYNRWLVVKYQAGHSETVLKEIHTMMDTHFPGRVFDNFLLKDNLLTRYKDILSLSGVINVFTVLSILIACFGLYGLSLFMAQQRTREIGIRKVYGSTSWQIISRLNSRFLIWICIAFIVAYPLSYFAISKWLENFAYRIAPSWWIFALVGAMVTGIAMLAVTWQTSLAARRNPVHTIRYE